MSTSNLAERNFRNLDGMEPEQMLKNLSIQENEDTSAQKQHCSLVKQITFSSPQGCNLRPSTFLDTFDNKYINGSHNDINADSDIYNECKEYDDRNKNLEHELKRGLLSHHLPNNDSEISDTLGNLEVSKELCNKGTSNGLKDSLVKQKVDSAPSSCHAVKEPYQHHKNSNNSLGVEMKYEPVINNNSSCSSNVMSGPKLLDASSEILVNSDTMQSNAHINVHMQYSDIVHNAEVEQEVTSADDGIFESPLVEKIAFPLNDTACISYNLQPRSANRESSIPFSSSHESRDTHTLNLKPVQYSDSSEVSDVKEIVVNTNDNLNFELSSIKEETDGINTSYRSSHFQSGSDERACTYSLTRVQCSDNAEVANVKQEIFGCVGNTDFEYFKEEMLSGGNISCASYNLRSRKDQGSSSKHVSSRYKEDIRISMPDSSENCKPRSVDMRVKQPDSYQMISSKSYNLRSRKWYYNLRNRDVNLKVKKEIGKSYNLRSRNWYYNLRSRDVNLKVKKEIGSEKNDKKHKYCKKISGYNLRPRNVHTGEFTSGPEGTCMFNYNSNRHYLQVKQIIGAQIENQNLISTKLSCGTYNLQRRNSPGSGSIHKEGLRICSSGLGVKCKSVNVEDVLVKQETSVCDDNDFSSPASNYEKSSLHNCSSDGVQVKRNTVTFSGYTPVENEILISSMNVSCKTYNLRPRTNQGDCSELVSLQHKKDTTICSSNLSHSYKSSSAQARNVKGEVKRETTLCDVDSFSRSYNMCSGTLYQKVGNMCVDMKLKEEIINDKKDKPKFRGERSPYNLRCHSRYDFHKYNDSNLYKNNDIKLAEIVAPEGTTPRISVNCSQLHEQRQHLEENASVGNPMHMITEVMSSERSVPYHLRSRRIVKEILVQDLSFRKDIKEEKGSEVEHALFEISKTVSGESIPIKNSKNVNTEHLEQQLVGIKENRPQIINNPVATTEIQNLGDGTIMNDSKFGCTKESFCEDVKQEMVANCADPVTSVQERSVSDINETNVDEIICLRSGRWVQKNVGNQEDIFHHKNLELDFLQNYQSHKSCIGQDELQVFGDEKHREGMDCFESNTVHLHPSGIRSDFQPCEKSDIGTETCLSSGHKGSPNNSLTPSEKVQIDCDGPPGAHDEDVGGLSSQMDVLSYDPLNDLSSSHTGGEKINNQDLCITELLKDLACDENNAETAGTSQDSKEFPCNKTSFLHDVNSTWQQTISDTESSIHKEQELLPYNNVNMTKDRELLPPDNNSMIREQKLICIDNTNIAKEQKYVVDVSHRQSRCDLSKDLLNIGNDPRGNGIIHETDDFLTAEDFDVNGTNTVEISVQQMAGNDCEKSDIRVPVEVLLPDGDALTAEDFNVDGPNTLKISAARKSLFIEDDRDRISEDTDSQDRNDSDVDMVELCMSIPMPKLSLIDGSLPGCGWYTCFVHEVKCNS
jgi:hypothetical protein